MNKKYIVIIVSVIAVALAVLASFALMPRAEAPRDLVTSKDLGLTDKEKQVFLDEIAKAQEKLNNLGSSASREDKYKLNLHIGAQYYGLGEYQKARDSYKVATQAMPDNATPWAELFLAENSMRDYENARTHLQKAIDLNPGAPQYWRWYIDLEREQFAATNLQLETIFIEALQKTGESVDMIALYAVFLEKQKSNLAEAVVQWKKAIDKNPAQKSEYEAEILRLQNLLK